MRPLLGLGLFSLLAITGYGQAPPLAHSPAEPDPHEDSIEQNAPVGDRDSPAKEPAKPLTVKPESHVQPPEKPQLVVKTPPVETQDAIIGTWELVPELSHFSPRANPPKEVRTYVRTADGIQATVTTTGPNGEIRTISYPWRVDGKEYPVTGSALLDTIVLRQINNLTAEATLRHGDVVLASERRELTADGKTMSITVKDLTSTEAPISSTAVYKKVQAPVQ